MGDVSPFETLANSIWNTLSWSFGSRRRHCTDTVPPTLARDLPCDPKLAPSSHHFSHDAHIISDLGKHCYVAPRFMRRMKGSPKVPSSHRFSHTVRLGRRNSSLASGRRWRAHLSFHYLCSHIYERSVTIPTTRQLALEHPILAFSVSEAPLYEETVPPRLQETSRAIQSLRLPRITFRTMPISYLTSGSTAT